MWNGGSTHFSLLFALAVAYRTFLALRTPIRSILSYVYYVVNKISPPMRRFFILILKHDDGVGTTYPAGTI